MIEAVIVSAVRTPIGRANKGVLREVRLPPSPLKQQLSASRSLIVR